MSKTEYRIGKMKFRKEVYFEILQETQDLLKELNQDNLINWNPSKSV